MSRFFLAAAVLASHLLIHFSPCRAFGTDAASTAGTDKGTDAEVDADALATCNENFETAKSACTDPKSTAGMSSQNAATTLSQMSTVTTLIASASGTKAAAQACLISNGLSAALQTINALKGDACSNSRSKCMNACRSANAKHFKSCDSYSTQVSNSLAQAISIAQSLAQAYSCYSALSQTTQATATPVELTSSTADCSNSSYAATNLVCICQNEPTNALCGSTKSASTASLGSTTTSATTPSLSTATNDGTEVDTTPIGAVGTSGSNTASGASGSSGLSGSSGSSGLMGSTDGSSGTSEIEKNVITGTSGSGSAQTGLTASGAVGGNGKAGGGSSIAGSPSDFDLKKYLPKTARANRGLAGMTIPSTDGVTGPMGPSLWEKVSNRYQAVKSSLIQDTNSK